MLLGLDPNGGTGMSEEWAARLAIEEWKNRWQELLIARGLLNGGARWDAQISEGPGESLGASREPGEDGE
jgi:hypothetical protein